ncbi:MAG TPA: c-type cytochrome [Methylomirabilota bacterium]|nr:c-type cytochrome [Methylomirabilota bacterium]
MTASGGPGAVIPPPPARVVFVAALVLMAPLLPAARATAQSVDERFTVCLACHGADGRSRIPETPSLGGQPAFFVIAQLFLFREGRRDNAPMVAAAKGLTNSDLTAFAERVTRLPPPPPPEDAPDPARFARGRSLTLRHPCGVCHNPDFSGREQMPRLANQREDYLLKSMREYKSGARLGYGGAMAQELAGLTDRDLIDLAHFLSHQSVTR